MEEAGEAIDLYTPEAVTEIYNRYGILRNTAPVYHEPRFGNWILTKHQDVKSALQDPGAFSSAKGVFAIEGGVLGSMLCQDPPRHDQLRQLVSKGFTPRVIASKEPAVKEIAEDLLDPLKDQDVFDFVPTVGIPMPIYVIADILCVPKERYKRFREWSDAFGYQMQGDDQSEEIRTALAEMYQYLREAIAERRRNPGDDLVSAVAQAEVDGQKLTDDELLDFCTLLLVAGQETTSGLLVNMIAILAVRPDIWKQVRADRSLVEAVVEETLRYEMPFQRLFRTTTKQVEMSSTAIPAGGRVGISYAAANRDPAVYPDPDSFQLNRSNIHEHLAFGSGIHFCLGAPLARLEAKVLLNTLLDRYEAIEPAPEIRRTVLRPGDPGYLNVPLRVTRAHG